MPQPLKIGLIGAGGVSAAHMVAFREYPDRLTLTAVADVRQENAAKRAQEMGVAPAAVYSDPERMCREAAVDAVLVCSPHAAHHPNTLAAIDAGKHVLVEKPMANSMRECREMVAAADKAGVVLMVGQTRRYDPSYRGVANVVRGGELGAVRAVRMDAMQNGPAALRHNSWLLDGAVAGGGVVISVAVHQLDLARLCIGEVRRVSATCRMLHPAFKNNAEDYAAAILEFESGAIGELFGTYSGYRQPWSESFMIFGDEGAIHAVPPPGQGHYSGPALVASTKRCAEMTGFLDMFKGYCAVEPATTDLPTDKPFVNQLLHFTDCCTTGKQPFSSGQDNLGTMKIVFGTYESARTGAPVDLARL